LHARAFIEFILFTDNFNVLYMIAICKRF